eukprot:NODE_4616_length_763_cov_17.367925_g4457_i0.p1 GENE.NODE_4616_length_763_cov_17.367925_g4457_i0~~NODE_4616_length_763_cov_17.367925_g4457_i0.p1  ORF type:complete len:244 (-),score=57.22 NODE_4616_length_763_cov_17.367925_g4457_i0:30-716(-)
MDSDIFESLSTGRLRNLVRSDDTQNMSREQLLKLARQGNQLPMSDEALIKRIKKRPTDLYYVLGIKTDATPDEIKKAYRRLALRLHPDKTQVSGAEEAFKAVSRAFEVLGDEKNRVIYDTHGVEAAEGNTRHRSSHMSGFHNWQYFSEQCRQSPFDSHQEFQSFTPIRFDPRLLLFLIPLLLFTSLLLLVIGLRLLLWNLPLLLALLVVPSGYRRYAVALFLFWKSLN